VGLLTAPCRRSDTLGGSDHETKAQQGQTQTCPFEPSGIAGSALGHLALRSEVTVEPEALMVARQRSHPVCGNQPQAEPPVLTKHRLVPSHGH
jgi:hypothetical protein